MFILIVKNLKIIIIFILFFFKAQGFSWLWDRKRFPSTRILPVPASCPFRQFCYRICQSQLPVLSGNFVSAFVITSFLSIQVMISEYCLSQFPVHSQLIVWEGSHFRIWLVHLCDCPGSDMGILQVQTTCQARNISKPCSGLFSKICTVRNFPWFQEVIYWYWKFQHLVRLGNGFPDIKLLVCSVVNSIITYHTFMSVNADAVISGFTSSSFIFVHGGWNYIRKVPIQSLKMCT